MDRDRLVKLLAMTTSDNDGEALNALRMANKMLAAEKMTWEQVLAVQGSNISITLQRRPMTESYDTREVWVPPHLKDKPVIEQMFRTIYAKTGAADTGFKEWLDSVHGWWEKNGSITQGQYQALRRSYGRVR